MWLFGSAVRDALRPDSDIDVLVAYKPGARPSLRELTQMENELARIFGRNVDLVERKAVERSPNYIRRKNILSSLEPIYAAR
jgi:predicted nucleotidyltransferase